MKPLVALFLPFHCTKVSKLRQAVTHSEGLKSPHSTSDDERIKLRHTAARGG
jgi:hypothetical protein